MNTDGNCMKHQELTRQIIGVFFDVYNELGPGFLESIYVEALALALKQSGLTIHREMPLTVHFRDRVVGEFRADLIVGGAVLVEAKACQSLHPTHKAQILNYLRATVLEVGLLVNFGPRPVVKRLLFDNSRKIRTAKAAKDIRRGVFRVSGAIPPHQGSSVATPMFSLAHAD
jgi:GxxExxY protein